MVKHQGQVQLSINLILVSDHEIWTWPLFHRRFKAQFIYYSHDRELSRNQKPFRIIRIKHLWLSQLNNCFVRSNSCSTIWNYRNRIDIDSGILKSNFRIWSDSNCDMSACPISLKMGSDSCESNCISISIFNREKIIWPFWPWTWRLNEHLDRTFAWWFQR